MNNKFKNGEEIWIIKGIGKKEGRYYYKKRGVIICRDPYYMDYNVKFIDGKEDWFDEIYIKKIGRRKNKNGNKKHKNEWL